MVHDSSAIKVYKAPILSPAARDAETGEVFREKIGELELGFSAEAELAALRQQQERFLWQAVATFLGIALAVVLVLRLWVIRPLGELDSKARALADGDLETPIDIDSRNEFGRLADTMEVMRSNLRASYEEIRTQNERLKALDELKSQFLANMSHEIRTPMNGILGFTELLLEGDLAPGPAAMAQQVYHCAEHMLRIIDDILDLSKIEAHKLTLELLPADLRRIAREAVELLRPKASERNVEIRILVDDRVPRFLEMDPTRMRQVFLNLCGNAVKFTENGRVELRVKLQDPGAKVPQAGERVMLRIEIADDGIGIPEEAKDTLFDSFTQADGSVTRLYGGTGLGLYISKALVERHGGRIWLDSEVGRGTTFYLEVPVRVVEAPEGEDGAGEGEEHRGEERAVPRGRVLLVEDSEPNQKLMALLLPKLGWSFHLAEDGEQAVEAIRSRPGGYSLILMDCQMPVLDGYSATEEIRRLEGDGGRCPIVALTANAMKGERERCLAAGMDDFLPKPIRIADLGKVIRKWTEQAPAPVALAEPVSPRA
ncbi:MAG: ATP-binding protein [Planctomycetota bacterium]